MPDLYAAYKALRNRAREFNLFESLHHTWVYMQHVAANPRRALPRGYGITDPFGNPREIPPQMLPPHQLDLLLRELLIHGQLQPAGSRTLSRWNDLATLINAVKAHADLAASDNEDSEIYDTLHRLIHQQRPWQTSILKRDMVRWWLMLQSPEVRRRAESVLGMTLEQYFFLAFVAVTMAEQNSVWKRFDHYREYGIEDAAADAFFARLSDTPEGHREAQVRAQVHTSLWEYSWNPLHGKPLILLPSQSGAEYACPVPPILHRRLYSGIFFDLAGTPGFPGELGKAFEALTGLTLQRGFPGLNAVKPAPYPGPRGVQHHGTDWLGCDGTANVFVECKLKRMTVAAKVLSDADIFATEIDTLAKAVVQNYRNIQEAFDGKSSWEPNELPTYNIVTTLEDWIIFSPTSRRQLDAAIDQRLREAELDPGLVRRAPYTICCAYELEQLVFAWADHGVQTVMAARHEGEHHQWMVDPFLNERFAESKSHRRAHDLFDSEAEAMTATIIGIARLGRGKA